jgi:hypothetical protein
MSENYYNDVYRRRLNRYGLDYQSRIQGQRERDFDAYLYKSIYRVDFQFGGDWHPASLERYKQDYSETQCYLLTKIDLQLPGGTILFIESRDGKQAPYMVWWLEQIEASGYNKYVVLKMTHFLEWEINGQKFAQWAYLNGPATSAILDAVKINTSYRENNNNHTFITSFNPLIKRDVYFEVECEKIRQGFVVKEFDINSTSGVEYVTVDPVPLRDNTPAPEKTSEDNDANYFWLNGGK